MRVCCYFNIHKIVHCLCCLTVILFVQCFNFTYELLRSHSGWLRRDLLGLNARLLLVRVVNWLLIWIVYHLLWLVSRSAILLLLVWLLRIVAKLLLILHSWLLILRLDLAIVNLLSSPGLLLRFRHLRLNLINWYRRIVINQLL